MIRELCTNFALVLLGFALGLITAYLSRQWELHKLAKQRPLSEIQKTADEFWEGFNRVVGKFSGRGMK